MKSLCKLPLGAAAVVVAGFCLCFNMLWAGSTGKIAGKVTDASNGEALVAANVVVVGTTYGATVGVDGKYTIVGVPIGVYSIRVYLIGYQEVIINNVKVA